MSCNCWEAHPLGKQGKHFDSCYENNLRKRIKNLEDALRKYADLENWLYCNPLPDGKSFQSIKWVGEDDPMVMAKEALNENK